VERVLAAALLSPAPPCSPVTTATCSEALLEARDVYRDSGCTSGTVLGLTDSDIKGCAEDVGRALEETFMYWNNKFGLTETTELFESPNWSRLRALKILVGRRSDKIERKEESDLKVFNMNRDTSGEIENSMDSRKEAFNSTNRIEGSEETRKRALKITGRIKDKIE
jgi:hypothetical protein